MKSTDLFDALNQLPDDMITSAEVSPEARAAGEYAVTTNEKRRSRASRIFSSGWFAAALSLVVSLGVVALIIRAGRTEPGVITPAGTAGSTPATAPEELNHDPGTPSVYSYQFSQLPALPHKNAFLQTETVPLTLGKTYTKAELASLPLDEPLSAFLADACLVHAQTGFRLPFVLTRMGWGKGHGDLISEQSFHLPLESDPLLRDVLRDLDADTSVTLILEGVLIGTPDATPAGKYDLVIGASKVLAGETFKGALTLTGAGSVTDKTIELSYTAQKTVVSPGESMGILLSVTNHGDAFSGFGGYISNLLRVTLRCVDYEISPRYIAEDEDDWDCDTLAAGETRGAGVCFTIPDDAPIGSYALEVEFSLPAGGSEPLTCAACFPARVLVTDDSFPVDSSETETTPKEPGYDDVFIRNASPALIYGQTTAHPGETALLGVDKAGLGEEVLYVSAYAPEGMDWPATVIGEDAFHGCAALKTLYLTKGIFILEPEAFAGCPGLKTIHYQGYCVDWQSVVNDAPDWNAGLGTVTVVCRDGELTFEGQTK